VARGFAGAPARRLDVRVWYPAAAGREDFVRDAAIAPGGPWPLIVYSHGTMGRADESPYLVRALVNAGYVVAAADYPLTSRNSHTKIAFADITDMSEQVKDIRFIIDRLLADAGIGKAIDKDRIGVTGHSLGGVTTYFAVYGEGIRDPRIKAAAPIAGADPVQTALSNGMGVVGTQHAPVSVPVLFLSASRDVFARFTGRPKAAWSRVEPPKYELTIRDGVHVWFHEGDDPLPDNRNPDCLFFDKYSPDMIVPGCEERAPLIAPERQREITRTALVAFFDAYLKDDKGALERLRTLAEGQNDVELIYEE
jgi:predicted dienelactone hydrolase